METHIKTNNKKHFCLTNMFGNVVCFVCVCFDLNKNSKNKISFQIVSNKLKKPIKKKNKKQNIFNF